MMTLKRCYLCSACCYRDAVRCATTVLIRQRHICSYGFTDTDKRIPISGDTLFAVGSVTKGFTAESAALLVADGALRWDHTIGHLMGKHVHLSEDARAIPLQQLTTHTAGLFAAGTRAR